ncbi:CtsR family transcriptional regulator [Caldanaerobius polysaccharolyticus]|uniref:CtsR family transcriptional regulator n=1 Tax=Caldanaerobius polysaccharolyticus TaxID=44256 RepID=UPI00047BB779|nr:CtsR family transcriptional regulator [Caldanaerobius polysaccharolyticus]
MARISDVIEMFIKKLIDEAQNGIVEIRRNELASKFQCTPSQINYVLETRFTPELGYYIESRRGGGGCIRIIKMNIDEKEYIKDIITEGIGSSISQGDAYAYINALYRDGIITDRELLMMKSALSDRVIGLDRELRNVVRASLFKAMLLAVLNS